MAIKQTVISPRTRDPKEIELWRIKITTVQNSRVSAADDDSTAADLATLVTDFNDLLAKLRAAGLMAE